MSENLKKFKNLEQVSSKATKPDESRKKSLYFLLLAIGRQRAIRNPTFRDEYRAAFNSLKIEKVEDFWEISVSVNGSIATQLVARNEFKFYATGFSEIQDSTVETNKKAANNFWEKIEAEIGIKSEFENQKKNALTAFFSGSMNITSSTLIIVALFYAFAISQRLILGIIVALYPALRLFWNSSKRIVAILICMTATISFGLLLDSKPLINNNPWFLAEAAVLLFLWARLYQSQYQSKNFGARFIGQILLMIGFATLALFSDPEPGLSMLTIFIIINSEFMQYLRRRSIHSTGAVFLTIFFEVTISIAWIVFLIDTALNGIRVSPSEIIFFGTTYSIWFIYLNIYERFPITFRLTYPILVSLVVLNHNMSSSFSIMIFITLLVSITALNSKVKWKH